MAEGKEWTVDGKCLLLSGAGAADVTRPHRPPVPQTCSPRRLPHRSARQLHPTRPAQKPYSQPPARPLGKTASLRCN